MNEQQLQATPTITLTEAASAKLRDVIKSHRSPVLGVRLEIVDRVQGEFVHILSLVEEGATLDEDVVVDVDGIRVFVERRSVPYVDRLQVHFEFRGPNVSGLQFSNPNPLWNDPREVEIQEMFDHQINPAIASHGGSVSLLGVEGTTAYVRLGGGCQGCGMASATLKNGIEASILQYIEGIERVVDQTDHSSGTNPYYQPSKK